MMKPRKPKESSVERDCVEWARERGILVTKNDTRANAGVPDRVFWLPGGRVLIIEFKRPGEDVELGSIQQGFIEHLRSAGYWIEVVETKLEFTRYVEYYLKKKGNR
jgi:hypothetical protein